MEMNDLLLRMRIQIIVMKYGFDKCDLNTAMDEIMAVIKDGLE
jgi:hypothetical protein